MPWKSWGGEITGLTEKSVNLIVNNKQAITPETATLLGKVFSTPAEMWLNLQARYDLRKIDNRDASKKSRNDKKLSTSIIKKKFFSFYTAV